MASRQSRLLLSQERLGTAPSYRLKRQGRLINLPPIAPPPHPPPNTPHRLKRRKRFIPHQPIVPQLSQRPIRRPRIRGTIPLAPTGLRNQTTGRKRTVRRQRNQTIGQRRIVRQQRSRG